MDVLPWMVREGARNRVGYLRQQGKGEKQKGETAQRSEERRTGSRHGGIG